MKALERWNLAEICPHLGRPCCLALCKSSRLLIAFETHFAFVTPESPDLEVRVADVYVPGGGEWKQESLRQEGFHVRLNDGRVDRNGRLVIGGINESFGDFQDGWKAVQPCFRVEMMRRTESNINGTTLSASTLQSIPLAKISNSICFSLDGSTMFYSDTPTKTICMSPYGDAVSGVGGEVVIQTDHQPDGSVIDAR